MNIYSLTLIGMVTRLTHFQFELFQSDYCIDCYINYRSSRLAHFQMQWLSSVIILFAMISFEWGLLCQETELHPG